MSDDIELNVDTLEPEEEEEEEEEKAISEDKYSCGQRIPMRKPATLVQYWINTGNLPYKVLLDENELSESGSSLSEKETTSLLGSPVTNAVNAVNSVNTINAGDKRKDSSCSSVDTAAYILSNANVTKKADTIAIIEGAKCIEAKSLKEVSIKDVGASSDDKIECMETTRINCVIHDDDSNVDVDVDDADSNVDVDVDVDDADSNVDVDVEVDDADSNVDVDVEVEVDDVDVDVDVDADVDADADVDDVDVEMDVDVDVDVSDTELYPMSRTKSTATEICDGAVASTLVSANAIQSNIYSQSEETDKIYESTTSQRNLDVHTIDDIALIFRQFDKTSKRLVKNDKSNDVSGQDRMLEMDAFHERQVSETSDVAREIIAKDTSLTAFHRKKLYTGRDSPVDLILTETHGTSRLSRTKQSLHPALDPDGTIKRKNTVLVHKGKNKRSLSVKRSLGSKKRKEGRELSCTSNKTITDISNKYTNDNRIQDSNIDSSSKSLFSAFQNNLDRRRDDKSFRECDDTNVSINNEKRKQNLPSLNLKPIVLLERIKPFKRRKLKFGKYLKNTHIAQKKNVHNDGRLKKFKRLDSCEIENLEVETIDNDESTILICQCNINASQHAPSLSDCSLNLKLNIEDDFSASNVERKGGELSSLRDTDASQNKELRIVEELPRSLTRDCTNTAMESQVSNKNNAICVRNKSKTYSYLYGKDKMDNDVKLREIKVLLERLPLSAKNCTSTTMKMQALNKNDAIWQKEISNKSKAHFSNPYGANKKDNGKLREIKVVLEQLPANICLKEISNVTNTNSFPSEKKISRNTSLQTNRKRESQIRKSSKILARENGAAIGPVRNNYSLRMNAKSNENNDKIGDIFDIVAESGNQVFDRSKTESDSTFQQETFRHKNRSEANRDKYSILSFTSDEDDFVRSIQYPRKRSKVSIDDDILDKPNIAEKIFCDQTKLIISDKNNDRSSRNLSTVICSSEETLQRDIGSIVEIKSFDGTRTTANEGSNGDFKSRIRDTRKDASSSSPINDVRNTCKTQHVREKMFSNARHLEATNLDRSLPEHKEISDKSKNALVIPHDETYVTPTVRKLLTFQTKSYYDSSDSNETL
ncbi:uncharacterized protein LOC143900017 isoform X2 [Temnothorax americanus]